MLQNLHQPLAHHLRIISKIPIPLDSPTPVRVLQLHQLVVLDLPHIQHCVGMALHYPPCRVSPVPVSMRR